MTVLMTPGPSEPTADELQEFSRLLIDDLIELERDGIIVGKTLDRPNGENFNQPHD
jgi:hypothetical protein